ncbi:uncharacterized protein Tco025E_08258 [Trypanosoma conorhini]|uniref:Uncharacterized protein n=1 Tax=Trypanosoma conorhini TaxID=83891 RepID=A0A422NC09_9TRYP|nr:uncharacterized protein Tco025E_08258 [Trypanosoma conorhini]RNF03040.1 hypothetical protein Tco025E_08258 [Trypanosoma conorhini]
MRGTGKVCYRWMRRGTYLFFSWRRRNGSASSHPGSKRNRRSSSGRRRIQRPEASTLGFSVMSKRGTALGCLLVCASSESESLSAMRKWAKRLLDILRRVAMQRQTLL